MSDREDFTATLTTLRTREATQLRPAGLVVRIVDGEKSREVPLVGMRVIGGRTSSHGIVLDDSSVSTTHFELVVASEGEVVLRDLGSKNGTSIHGVKVREVVLEPGARFCAGNVSLELAQVDQRHLPVSVSDRFGGMLGRGVGMGRLFADLARLAEMPLDVLVRGETGTGKELVARALHDGSHRAGGPFVIIDCTCLPPNLADSMLFGHTKGSFTGAEREQVGLFESAHGGTVFIDEVGKLPVDAQPKLLRVLESREVARLGDPTRRSIDVRVVAATNRDVAQLMADGEWLEDLYYRLGEIEIEIPALRDRGAANLKFLAGELLERECLAAGRALAFSPDAYEAMAGYSWPGNVRELQRAIKRAVYWSKGDTIEASNLKITGGSARIVSSELDDLLSMPYRDATAAFEAMLIRKIWADADGNVSEAARQTGLHRRTLAKMFDSLGLREANATE